MINILKKELGMWVSSPSISWERKQFSSAACCILCYWSIIEQQDKFAVKLFVAGFLLSRCKNTFRTVSVPSWSSWQTSTSCSSLVDLDSLKGPGLLCSYTSITLNSCSLSHFYKVQNTTTTSVFVTYLPCRRTHTSVRENTSSPFFVLLRNLALLSYVSTSLLRWWL